MAPKGTASKSKTPIRSVAFVSLGCPKNLVDSERMLGLLAQDSNLNGSFWAFLEDFNINTAGLFTVGVFVLTWIVALAVWHFGRIEQKWETRPDTPE